MKKVNVFFALPTLLQVLLGTPPPASAQTTPPAPVSNSAPVPITSCGRVTQNVQLANDLVTINSSCLTVGASGVTIDGAGHRITAATYAVQWVNFSNVTVKNIVTDQTLQIYGATAGHNLVTDSTLGLVGIYAGDDNVVQNSTLKKLKIYPVGYDPAQREVITGNVIAGPLVQAEEKLVEIVSGTDGTLDTDGTYVCADAGHLITNNQIIGTVVPATSTVEPELFYMRCGRNSTVSGNTIRSGQLAVGILVRDGADDNLFENNNVEVGNGNEGALLIQNGSAGYHNPRDNTFLSNVFRADQNRALWLQASATRGNTFLQNLITSGGGSVETARVTDGPGVTMLFDHNSFYRPSQGTLLVFRTLGSGKDTFTNNIFSYPGGSNGVFNFDKLQSLAAYQGDYNVFYNSSGPVMFSQYYVDLPHWKYYTGQDTHSVEANPGFMSPQTGDFSLSPNSVVQGDASDGSNPGVTTP